MKTSTGKAATTAAAIAALTILGLGRADAQDATPGPVAAAPDATTPAPRPGLSEGVAAIVNDEIISTYDLAQRVLLLLVTTGVQPTPQNLPQVEQEALSGLIDEHLEIQEVRREEKEQKFQIVADDDSVNGEIAAIAQGNNTTADQRLRSLAGAGVSPGTFRDQIRAQLSWSRWIQGRYGGSRLKVSDAQVNEVLRQIQLQASQPEYEISEIFIDASRVGGMDAAMNGANQLIAQIQQGAPFGGVARQFSSASTAANGGDAGWLSEAEMPAELRPAVEELRPGQLSRPIPVENGVYIVYLRDKRAGAGEEMVELKQAAISLPQGAADADVDAARQKLLALKAQLSGCDGLEAIAGKVPGVVAGDLGQANVKDLRPSFRDAIQTLKAGEISDPIRTEAGLHLIAVCDKRRNGASIPTRADIVARLEDQQLSLISRRYLRDLRNSATIETR